MENLPLQNIWNSVSEWGPPAARWLVPLGCVLLGLYLISRGLRAWLGKRRRREPDRLRVEPLDLATLGEEGPPAVFPRLEAYHLPMRLALAVLAPLGRAVPLPAESEVPALLDHMVPGLRHVMDLHRARARVWPEQLSAEGFTRRFFAHANLPGNHGQGTPFCVLAGRFTAGEHAYVAGLVLVSDKPNNLGEIVVERETGWLDILRIRRSS